MIPYEDCFEAAGELGNYDPATAATLEATLTPFVGSTPGISSALTALHLLFVGAGSATAVFVNWLYDNGIVPTDPAVFTNPVAVLDLAKAALSQLYQQAQARKNADADAVQASVQAEIDAEAAYAKDAAARHAGGEGTAPAQSRTFVRQVITNPIPAIPIILTKPSNARGTTTGGAAANQANQANLKPVSGSNGSSMLMIGAGVIAIGLFALSRRKTSGNYAAHSRRKYSRRSSKRRASR